MIGQMVGSYEITGELGEGGMGQVFSAVNRQYNRRVAIKLLLPQFSSNQEVVTRFFNEARAAGAIDHPGIVGVHECGFDQVGRAFIAMDYLQGETLTARLARYGKMPADHVAAIGRMMAEALTAAHAKEIIHRDLKPDNAMIVFDGQYERIKLLDFGLAKLQGDLASPNLKTRTGTFMGTPTYMSPEQCLGAGGVDARSDIYSLGCVLYELAAGRPPFAGEEFGRLVAAHLAEKPPPLSQFAPEVPARLERLIMRMLEKKPEDRYQTMSQVASAFAAMSANQTLPPAAAAGGPAGTGPHSPVGSGPPQYQQHGSGPPQPYQQNLGSGAPQQQAYPHQGYPQNPGSGAPQQGYAQNPGSGAPQQGYAQNPGSGPPQQGYAQNPQPGSRPPSQRAQRPTMDAPIQVPRRRNPGPTPIPELPKPQRLWIPIVALLVVTIGLVLILVKLV